MFATSAGEVGVDLDADHMVADLVAWERMVQRLGRVNRRGNGEADVILVIEPEPKPTKQVQAALMKDAGDLKEAERKAVAKYQASIDRSRALAKLIPLLPRKNGAADVSPGALRALKLSAEADPDLHAILDAATTRAPLRPALSRAVVDAWSMTSLEQHTGRPEIDPWLRGWVEDDRPQTAVVWRTYLPVRRRGSAATAAEVEAFFEAAPPHTSEILETETFRVVEWLTARVKASVGVWNSGTSAATEDRENGEDIGDAVLIRSDDVAAVVLTSAGDVRKTLKVDDLILPDDDKDGKKKSKAQELEHVVAGATVVVDARIGGLEGGLLSDAASGVPRTADDGQPWISVAAVGPDGGASETAPVVRFRVRSLEAGQPIVADPQWRERLRFASELSDEGEPSRWIVVEKWRYDPATEEDRSAGRPQLLEVHRSWTEDRARALGRRLGLSGVYIDVLGIAARLHDEGKRARRWQRAFNAAGDAVYAKTSGPLNTARLDGYRHEFGSLALAGADSRLRELPAHLQDLVLHLIAAHHGFARPIIRTDGCEDAPPSALEGRAREVTLRFARLQKQWGPWGLAWWEALLRAADQQASRENDAPDAGR